MKTDIVKFEKINIGWDITFNITLTDEENSKCNMDVVEHIGDYEIKLEDNVMSFSCIFTKEDLWENETIDDRLKLIQKDIEQIANSCLT